MPEPILINPFKCKIWALHDRLEGEITEENCRAEIASFLSHGQLIPVLGRRLSGNPDHEIELICGARRLFVARHLNQPLLVDLRELSDREAIIAMDMENRLRKDISPYERGLSYAHWLRSAHFESQEEIARGLNVSTSQVSRLLRLSRLPAVVVDAFRSPTEICENWGLDLMDALQDPKRRDATIRAARMLARNSPRLIGRDVYRQMCTYSDSSKSKPKSGTHDKVVTGVDGSRLFRIKYQNNSIALVLPASRVSRESMQQIESMLAEILQESPIQNRTSIVDLGAIGKTVMIDSLIGNAIDGSCHNGAHVRGHDELRIPNG